jgi:hypothetical protein
MHGNMSICITLEYREKAFRETTLFIVERRAINPIYNYRIVIDLSVVMLVKLTHSLTRSSAILFATLEIQSPSVQRHTQHQYTFASIVTPALEPRPIYFLP